MPVCIDAASSAFAAVELYAVLAAVWDVHFVFDDLMPAEDDRRLDLPEEEERVVLLRRVVREDVSCRIFLHGQIEGQALCLVCRKSQVGHLRCQVRFLSSC